MRRADLQQLAEDRLLDAQALLVAGRWAGAYYIAGYAVEAALKSCILAHIEDSGKLFTELTFLKSLSECWSHDLVKLVRIAGLQVELDLKRAADEPFGDDWDVVKNWSEISRYQDRDRTQAEFLIEAISREPGGVLSWIRNYW